MDRAGERSQHARAHRRRSRGLPMIRLSVTTTVSAASTIAAVPVRALGDSDAPCRARPGARSREAASSAAASRRHPPEPPRRRSPRCVNSSARRGDADARISAGSSIPVWRGCRAGFVPARRAHAAACCVEIPRIRTGSPHAREPLTSTVAPELALSAHETMIVMPANRVLFHPHLRCPRIHAPSSAGGRRLRQRPAVRTASAWIAAGAGPCGTRDTRMRPIQQFTPAVLAEVIRRQPPSEGRTTLAWQVAVGAAIARATTVRAGRWRADGHAPRIHAGSQTSTRPASSWPAASSCLATRCGASGSRQASGRRPR